jgi:hypothetical protein
MQSFYWQKTPHTLALVDYTFANSDSTVSAEYTLIIGRGEVVTTHFGDVIVFFTLLVRYNSGLPY